MTEEQSNGPTHLSLCAGIGGIDLGLRRVVRGIRTVAMVEREAFCIANLVKAMEQGTLDSCPTFFGSLGTDTEAWWISSAADFHASRSQSLVVAKPPRMKDISGLTSNQGLLFSNQKFVSLRTSMESLLPDPPDTTQFSTMSSATWNQWVTEQRQDSSQRRKLARRTCEKGGSSWPTPTARDWKDGTNPSDKAPTNGLLGRAVPRDPTSQPGQLSPDWVDMLMGFPVGWTDLEPWVTR